MVKESSSQVTLDRIGLLALNARLDKLIERIKRIAKSNGYSKHLKKKAKEL